MVEGAPLLREYRVKSLIEGSNPSLSASQVKQVPDTLIHLPGASGLTHISTHILIWQYRQRIAGPIRALRAWNGGGEQSLSVPAEWRFKSLIF